MLLGVHCSVSGGLDKAYIEAHRLGINTFQIFSRNQRQWNAKPIDAVEAHAFHQAGANSAADITFSHCSYLINLASYNDELWIKSIQALKEEVERCTILGLNYCVLHPGAAGQQSLEEAIMRIATALREVIACTPDSEVKILLENTAGQGTSVGGKFENLAFIKEMADSNRIAYCIDTCHTLAAGYDIRTQASFEDTIAHADQILGLEHIKVFHLNDSKGDLGSHLDRHEHIGQGKIGLIAFQQIMRQFPHIPKVLETPKEKDMDPVNLELLRGLI